MADSIIDKEDGNQTQEDCTKQCWQDSLGIHLAHLRSVRQILYDGHNIPVSYTHLDVYKRQPRGGAIAAAFFPAAGPQIPEAAKADTTEKQILLTGPPISKPVIQPRIKPMRNFDPAFICMKKSTNHCVKAANGGPKTNITSKAEIIPVITG